ncbi:hypothetical protein [Brucella intermedia]|uniref:hypothetical protein n=1 Tax=Brucella intermedia TaxID=94625 RepID=UPI00124D0713|nr:hypothetical protein [Brucella intermedia]KAB2693870.1 hypothetical protein F9K72_15150 [Brucella intermedia]
MAQDKTSNYQFALPNPVGIQIAEMQKVADSIIAIDAKLKASETALSTHRHSFADLLDKPTTLEGYGITDGMTAAEIAAAIKAAIDGVVNGSGAALDTLKKIADALGNDPQFATTVSNALGVRVRVDAAQSFSLAQKAQGRGNLDALGTVDKGKANGVASLDGTGKVPATQLPAMEYLPLTGGKVNGETHFRNGTNASGAHVLGLGWRNKDFPLWKFVIETDGSLLLAGYNSDTGTWLKSPIRFIRNTNDPSGVNVEGDVRATAWIYAGEANLQTDGNVFGSAWGGKLSDFLNTARLGASAFPRRSDGHPVQFQWSGQPGQPTWVWGGTGAEGDAGIYRVWNPANWSVNYANSTWNSERLQGWDIAGIQNDAQARANGKARKAGSWDQWNFTFHDQRMQNNTGENIYYTAKMTGTYADSVQLQISPDNGTYWTVATTLEGAANKTEFSAGCLPPGWWMRLIRGSGSYNANVILVW